MAAKAGRSNPLCCGSFNAQLKLLRHRLIEEDEHAAEVSAMVAKLVA